MDLNKIYFEPCISTMERFKRENIVIDTLIADPPYGVGRADWDNEFQTDWISLAQEISKRQLIMPGTKNLPEFLKIIKDYKELIILRNRNGMARGLMGFGNYIPVIASGDWPYVARPNLVSFNVKITEEIKHPSPKPLEAMYKLLHYYTVPWDLIYDPFMGSGTTAIACINSDRNNWIGSEINKEYIAEANRRILIANSAIKIPFPK